MVDRYTDMDSLTELVFRKITNPKFGDNLGGELPLFIQPYPAEWQMEETKEVNRLVTRLERTGIMAVAVDLYKLCMDILSEEGLLESILDDEAGIDKENIVATFDSVLDIKSVIIPRISELISQASPKFVFIHSVGHVYPFVRSHGILNNITELSGDTNIVLLFPGEYDSLQLRLFNRIADENYYRGYNLDDISV